MENLMIEEWYKQSPENEKRLDQIYFILCVKDRMEVMNSVNPEEGYLDLKISYVINPNLMCSVTT